MGAIIIEGIVIDSVDYDDFAKLVKVFSKQYGIISFYAPGVNKENSKNKYSIQNLSYSEFEIFKARKSDKISKLKTGRLISDYYAIASNYNNYIYISVMINIITQILTTGQKELGIFKAFKEALDNIKVRENSFINYLFFLFFVIQNSLFKLQLVKCGRCRKTSNKFVRFEYVSKTLICSKCLWPDEVIQPESFINIFLNVIKMPFSHQIITNYVIEDIIVLHIFLINYLVDELGIFIGALKVLKNTALMKVNDRIIKKYK